MKINEIITEDIWDDIKNKASGIKQRGQNVLGKIGQTYKSIKPRYQSQQAVKQQQAINKQVINNAQQQYNQFAARLDGNVTTPQALAWFEKFAGKQASTLPANTSPLAIQQWLAKEIPLYIANKAQQEVPVIPTETPPAVQQSARVSSPTNPGAPTPAEQAKLQQKIQAAMDAQK